jgi:hypothetical protein
MQKDRLNADVRQAADALHRLGAPTRLVVLTNADIAPEAGGGSFSPSLFGIGRGTIFLDPQAMQSLRLTGQGIFGASTAIGTLYHEATHAYFDAHKDDPTVRELVERGTTYYTGAPLTNGKKASDPSRIFQEAAASYVGERIASWLNTYTMLKGLSERGNLTHAAVERVAKNYDRQMSDMSSESFGYESSHNLGPQVSVDKTLPDETKQFLDDTVLEGKIHDKFNDDPTFTDFVQKNVKEDEATTK